MIKKLNDISTIGIIGAGTMGIGIAQLSLLSGYATILYDINREILERAEKKLIAQLQKGVEKGKISNTDAKKALHLLLITNDIKEVNCDFVIEAVVENLKVKQSLFADLQKLNPTAILASNTSSIPITQIAAPLPYPQYVVGMHFFNPAHIMKLVEVISGVATEKLVADITRQLAEKMGKVAVAAADAPGFIVNRVARHFYVESLKALEEGVADVATIDTLIRSSGFKMGPFELMDLIGVDTNFSVTTSMFNAFHQDGKFRPSRIQQQKVDAGYHGKKSGRGFYNYD